MLTAPGRSFCATLADCSWSILLWQVLRASHLIQRWENSFAIQSTKQKLYGFALFTCVLLHWFACLWALLANLQVPAILHFASPPCAVPPRPTRRLSYRSPHEAGLLVPPPTLRVVRARGTDEAGFRV